jgi:hypothetical protein
MEQAPRESELAVIGTVFIPFIAARADKPISKASKLIYQA